jgi:hypothetical protein
VSSRGSHVAPGERGGLVLMEDVTKFKAAGKAEVGNYLLALLAAEVVAVQARLTPADYFKK